MLDFVIFAVTFIVALIVAIIYLSPSSKSTTTIPGLDPSSKQDGNLADIIRAGSLHEFLLSLHQQYGSIVSFWMGNTQIVSLGSPQLIDSNKKGFDRSSELYVLFEPLLGSQNLLYASGDEGRQRRSNFTNAFTDEMIADHCNKLGKISDELLSKWSSMSEQHIPIEEHMMALSVRFQLLKTLGNYFENNEEILKLRRNFDTCWNEFEKLLQDLAEPESHRRQAFSDAQEAIETILAKAIENHRKTKSKSKTHLLIDTLLTSKATDEQIITDCFLTILFDFHTLGGLLTWTLYFLATHGDIQTKLAKEIKTLKEGEPTMEDLKKLKFLKQVLNETHRCAVLNQWSATSQNFDTEIGGHKIPKNTPIINAVGVLMQDEKYCSLPIQFDPDRFSDDSLKSSSTTSPVPFQPFAHADKRTRLANDHIQLYASVFLVKVLRKFRLSLVKGQVVTPVYGLVTHPDDEIWITAAKLDKS